MPLANFFAVDKRNMDIALIGVGCRFPGGVKNVFEFWNMLLEGKDCITEIPADRYV